MEETSDIRSIVIPNGFHAIINNEKRVIEIMKDEDERKPSKSWNEFCKKNNAAKTKMWFIDKGNARQTTRGLCISTRHRNIFRTKEEAEAVSALIQLLLLRDDWIGEWKPCYRNGTKNYSIVADDEIAVCSYIVTPRWLTFPSNEMANEFLETFKPIIEQARPLL